MSYTRRSIALLVVSALGLLLVTEETVAQHSRTVRDSVQLAQDGKLKIVMTRGTADVRGWDRSFVAIEATVKGNEPAPVDATKILVEGDSSRVTVRADNADADGLGLTDLLGFGGSEDLLTDYRVRIPKEASLKISAESGAIQVQGIDGDVTVEAGSASSRIRDIGGRLIAGTFSGSVDAANVRGKCVFGSFSGSLTFDASPLPDGCEIGTFSGDAEILLPADAAFDLRTDISWGGVSSDFPMPDSSKTDEEAIPIGGGGPEIVFGSFTGHLTLRAR